MRAYLETMKVPDMAIEAHEKGESDFETYQTIYLTDTAVKIVKRSRVNDDVVVELTLGEEKTEWLRAWSTDRSVKNPEQRPKKALATTEDPGVHLKIQNSLLTVNGMAHVTDTKRLVQEEVDNDGAVVEGGTRSVLVQELVITNEMTGATNTTTRYFLPFDGKLEGEDESPAYGGSAKLETE